MCHIIKLKHGLILSMPLIFNHLLPSLDSIGVSDYLFWKKRYKWLFFKNKGGVSDYFLITGVYQNQGYKRLFFKNKNNTLCKPRRDIYLNQIVNR